MEASPIHKTRVKVIRSYPKEAKQLLMTAELSHLLSVDEIKHKHEKTVKGKWERSYRAVSCLLSMADNLRQISTSLPRLLFKLDHGCLASTSRLDPDSPIFDPNHTATIQYFTIQILNIQYTNE